MKQSTIDRMRRCSQLISPTGGVMVKVLLDEVERLQASVPETCSLIESEKIIALGDLKDGDAFIFNPGKSSGLYMVSGSSRYTEAVQCVLLGKDRYSIVFDKTCRVYPVKIAVSWELK